MPLITITTHLDRHPADDPTQDTPLQALTARFGEELPAIVLAHVEELPINPNTPLDGVQVDYDLFHPRSVNTVDLWMFVLFTEECEDQDERWAARDVFKRIVIDWFKRHAHLTPSVETQTLKLALDVFWGPGVGFLRRPQNGIVVETNW